MLCNMGAVRGLWIKGKNQALDSCLPSSRREKHESSPFEKRCCRPSRSPFKVRAKCNSYPQKERFGHGCSHTT